MRFTIYESHNIQREWVVDAASLEEAEAIDISALEPTYVRDTGPRKYVVHNDVSIPKGPDMSHVMVEVER
jgi:hypothetical protein